MRIRFAVNNNFGSDIYGVVTNDIKAIGLNTKTDSQREKLKKKSPGGRPCKFTPELALTFLNELAKSGIALKAAERAGISRITIWRWRKKIYGFDHLYQKAMAHSVLYRKNNSESWHLEYGKNRKLLKQLNRVINTPPGEYAYRQRGRQPTYKKEHLEHVSSSWSETAKALGVCRKTVANWCRKYPSFKKKQEEKSLERELPVIMRKLNELSKDCDNNLDLLKHYVH